MSAYTPEERKDLLSELDTNERRELRFRTRTVSGFATGFIGVRLRPYQVRAAEAIARSVFARDGETFVVLFARQSGKDEMIANLILFLLARLGEVGGSIVCVQPTFHPQSINAMNRLQERAFQRRFFQEAGLRCKHGYIYRHGLASVSYFSGDPSANVVGPTADRLLIINEAQDVSSAIYDRRFAPMAAAGNATRLFSGTAWTADTLLEREKRLALQRQEQDGLQRVFIVDGRQVARHNRHYGCFLKSEILKLGRDHPLIRTQYFCENVDARSRMFTPAHRALMHSDSPLPMGEGREAGSRSISEAILWTPAGRVRPLGVGLAVRSSLPVPAAYPSGSSPLLPSEDTVRSVISVVSPSPHAFLLDVAGQEESSTSYSDPARGGFGADLNYAESSRSNSFDELQASAKRSCGPRSERRGSRDSVTLRIVEIDLSTLEILQAPTYRVVYSQQWTGQNHLVVFGQLKSLGEAWRPLKIVIDATGVGEGLWAMLDRLFPTRVIPVKFTQHIKSELGYGFLAIINTGRFRDCVPSPETDRQYAACESEILIGPARTMRWGVPEGRRDEAGRLIHDDIPVTDSLTAILDKLTWSVHSPTLIVSPPDPLLDMDTNF